MRRLDVYLNDVHIGYLDDTSTGIVWSYAQAYANRDDALPLSFKFPIRLEPYAGPEVEQYFSNLLPDDYVRTRIGEILKIPLENTFALLEAIGGDCAGAISFYPEGVDPVGLTDPQYRELDEQEAVRILADLEKRPLDVGDEGVRISGAGAQDKLVAVVRDGRVLLPLNGTPSTHIIKPDIRNYPGSSYNEFFCMRLAAACRLDVASCDLLQLAGRHYYVTERYDREMRGGTYRRLHQEDFCQILGIDPKDKYETRSGLGFVRSFELLRELELSAAEVLSFLDRLIFNFLVGNGDAHGKNFSILYRDGKRVLAPMYDVMCTTVYPEVGKRMAMKIDGAYDFKWVTRGKFLRLGEKIGVGGKLMQKALDKLSKRIMKEAPLLAARLKRKYPSAVYDQIVAGILRRCDQIA